MSVEIPQYGLYMAAHHDAEVMLERQLLGWSPRALRDIPTKLDLSALIRQVVSQVPDSERADLRCDPMEPHDPEVCLVLKKLGRYYGLLHVVLLRRWCRAYAGSAEEKPERSQEWQKRRDFA